MTAPRPHAELAARFGAGEVAMTDELATTALCLLKELVAALDETHWSSWQSTARFDNQLTHARIFLAELEEKP